MNKLIADQLNKVRIATIPKITEGDDVIIIPKSTPDGACEVLVDKCYLIELDTCLVQPPNGYTLHTNWNNGRVPKDKFMKCQVVADLGKMIKIVGVGYDNDTNTDLNTTWDGWLPKTSVKVISKLD